MTEGSHNRVAFKTILLSKCQTEFEKDKQEEKEIADLQKNLNEAEDEEEKKKLKEELDTAMWRGKKRSLGNTKLIFSLDSSIVLLICIVGKIGYGIDLICNLFELSFIEHLLVILKFTGLNNTK